ncbi:hypothetical protein C0J52_22513 [Blattella germanica]|nr:hypothetical protein C0J52_22513 [Blattella germanica]
MMIIIDEPAVLHNIAILTRDEIPPEDMTLVEYINARRNRIIVDNIPVLDVAEEARTAVAFRNGIVQQHFAW